MKDVIEHTDESGDKAEYIVMSLVKELEQSFYEKGYKDGLIYQALEKLLAAQPTYEKGYEAGYASGYIAGVQVRRQLNEIDKKD